MNGDLFAHTEDRVPTTGIAGVDEAGRGPLIGPVVVAAVVLDPIHPIAGLADSKTLCESRREILALRIREHAACFAISIIDHEEIDRLNILHATLLGMSRALAALTPAPLLALIDGNRLPSHLPCPARTIVGGDASEPAISAASILAKTVRDQLMRELDALHPGWGFARHKGYPTPEHLRALGLFGPLPSHRRSFAPVRQLLGKP